MQDHNNRLYNLWYLRLAFVLWKYIFISAAAGELTIQSAIAFPMASASLSVFLIWPTNQRALLRLPAPGPSAAQWGL